MVFKGDFEHIKVNDHTSLVKICVHVVYYFIIKRTMIVIQLYITPFLIEKLKRSGGFLSALVEFLANFWLKFNPQKIWYVGVLNALKAYVVMCADLVVVKRKRFPVLVLLDNSAVICELSYRAS